MQSKSKILLLACLLAYASTQLVEKYGIDRGVAPVAFGLLSNLSSFCFIGVLWLGYKSRGHIRPLKPGYTVKVAVIGFLASGVAFLLALGALTTTSATNKGVMQGAVTAMTAWFAHLWLGERLSRTYYLVLLLLVVGIVLLTSHGFLQWPTWGDGLLLLTVPVLGFSNAFSKHTLEGADPLTLTWGRYIFGCLFIAATLPFFGFGTLASVGESWMWMVLAGCLSAIRVLTFYQVIRLEGPTLPTTVLAVGPAITAIGDALFLGSRFNLLQITGLALAIAGGVLLSRQKASF